MSASVTQLSGSLQWVTLTNVLLLLLLLFALAALCVGCDTDDADAFASTLAKMAANGNRSAGVPASTTSMPADCCIRFILRCDDCIATRDDDDDDMAMAVSCFCVGDATLHMLTDSVILSMIDVFFFSSFTHSLSLWFYPLFPDSCTCASRLCIGAHFTSLLHRRDTFHSIFASFFNFNYLYINASIVIYWFLDRRRSSKWHFHAP